MTAAAAASPNAAGGKPPTAWHALSVDDALAAQGVTVDQGLSTAEADKRRAAVGTNTFTEGQQESRFQAFLRQYQDPMQIVLVVAGVISLFLPGQFATGVVLIALTLLNAGMGLNQEGKASASVSALQKMMVVKAKVRRDGQLVEVPMEQLVPGDIVSVEAGDLVPADSRILRAATLEIDELALTGESAPVPKQVDPVEASAALGDQVDLAFMNTQVTRGTATLVVVTTGMATEVGHISGMLNATKIEKTPLTQQLEKLTNQILVIAGVALLASIGIGLARGNSFQVLFLTAVAFAVSAIPTGLPAVVTAVLSAGTTTLAGAGAIVKRLRSVETLGSTSAINSDKTGTLTLNQMTAVEMTIVGRRYNISGEGYSTEGKITQAAGQADIPLDQYMLPMALCADAVVRDGDTRGRPDRGRPGRPRRQGRGRPAADPRAVPADRRGSLRRGLQVHGHVPPDEGPDRQGRRPGVRQGRPRPAPRAGLPGSRSRRGRHAGRRSARPVPGRERASRQAGPAGHGHGPARLRAGHVRSQCRPPAADQGPHPARPGRHRRPAPAAGAGPRSPSPIRPGFASG